MYTQYLAFNKKKISDEYYDYDILTIKYTIDSLNHSNIISAFFTFPCDRVDIVNKILPEFINNGIETLLETDFSYIKTIETETLEEAIISMKNIMTYSLLEEVNFE